MRNFRQYLNERDYDGYLDEDDDLDRIYKPIKALLDKDGDNLDKLNKLIKALEVHAKKHAQFLIDSVKTMFLWKYPAQIEEFNRLEPYSVSTFIDNCAVHKIFVVAKKRKLSIQQAIEQLIINAKWIDPEDKKYMMHHIYSELRNCINLASNVNNFFTRKPPLKDGAFSMGVPDKCGITSDYIRLYRHKVSWCT